MRWIHSGSLNSKSVKVDIGHWMKPVGVICRFAGWMCWCLVGGCFDFRRCFDLGCFSCSFLTNCGWFGREILGWPPPSTDKANGQHILRHLF